MLSSIVTTYYTHYVGFVLADEPSKYAIRTGVDKMWMNTATRELREKFAREAQTSTIPFTAKVRADRPSSRGRTVRANA